MVRACQFCRRRKIKCDTGKPSCGTCRTNKRSCVYENGPRAQRPSAALINALQGEKAALERLLQHLKNADEHERRAVLDSMVDDDGRTMIPDLSAISTAISTAPSVDTLDEYPSSAPAQQLPNNQLNGTSPTTAGSSRTRNHCLRNRGDENGTHGDKEGANDDDGDDSGTGILDINHNNAFGSSSEEDETASYEKSEAMFSSSTAVGRMSPAPIALFEKSRQGPSPALQMLRYQLIANAATQRQREHQLRRATTIRGIPAELALHLLDLHWNRQHHTFLLTYRPAFMRELIDGGPYCSDLLLYAVFACSTKFSERLDVRTDLTDPESAGRHFFSRCDELLFREGHLSKSCIPTVIALLMLGSTFIARGLISKGWLYTGYALRMVYDLGLHIDPGDISVENVEEVEIRRRVFWGAFICEKLQSLYLGRPPTIRLRDAHVSLDFMDTFEELEPWTPYCDSRGFVLHNTFDPGPTQRTYTYSVTVFQQLCLLAKIMTRIMNKIYFVGATAQKTRDQVIPLDDALTSWYNNLPTHLVFEPWATDLERSNTTAAPNRLIILTTYHSLVILLHRPFISVPDPSGDNNPDPDPSLGLSGNGRTRARSTTSPFSWKRCTTAARDITRLALSYRSIYPLRRSSYLLSYAVYVACTIHVLNAPSARNVNGAGSESSLMLGASLRCLDELAIPNSGVADTACIIRKLMAAKGVLESSVPSDLQVSVAQEDLLESMWPAFNASPTYDDAHQMQLFQDLTIPGPDLLFGFMKDDMTFEAFPMNEFNG